MRGRSYLLGPGAALTAGVLTFLFAPSWIAGTARLVAAYDAAAVASLAINWTFFMSGNPTHTRKYAAVQDPGRIFVFFLVLLAVVAGLVAAIGIIGRSPGAHHDGAHVVSLILGVGAIALGWLLIHTSFTYRYAHLYYRDSNRDLKADAGLIFPGNASPSDYDFAYFSFVLGMTFQVSDVQITSGVIRRVALAHGLVSFAYNATIFGVTVNVIASLLQSG